MKLENHYIKLIQELEPVFHRAGELSVKLQTDIVAKKKFNTGSYELDVVTDADTAVQEVVLSALSKTKLSECKLIAEEKTESVNKFNPKGDVLLAIDPIDGTYRYAAGKPIYSLIVSIQKLGLPLYTFVHFPAIGWTHRFIGKAHHEIGQRPKIDLENTTKTIVHSYGNPEIVVPETVRKQLETRGYHFKNGRKLTSRCGSTALLFTEVVDGYYCEDPPAYDGLVGMHYALTHGLEMQSDLANEPTPGVGGMRYSGYYFVIRK